MVNLKGKNKMNSQEKPEKTIIEWEQPENRPEERVSKVKK